MTEENKPKKRKLTVSEKFYIKSHRHMTAQELSMSMHIPSALIKIELAALVREDKAAEKAEKEAAEKKKQIDESTIKAKNLFIRNKKRGVTVMTPESSQLGEGIAKNAKKIPRSEEFIHRIE